MTASIIGLGTALPSNTISQSASCSFAKTRCANSAKQNQVIEKLYRRTGIETRTSVLVTKENEKNTDFFPLPNDIFDTGPTTAKRMHRYNLEAAELAERSCRLALDDAQLKSSDITHLITVSCTGFAAPGLDVHLVKSLSMNPNIYRTHLGFMGCHGAMNALRVAQGFCSNSARVLICATEICSIHFQYGWETNNLVANSLFADGSGAMVLSNEPGKVCYHTSQSFIVPDTEDVMTWQIGDNGFTMTLSAEVPDLIEKYLPNLLKRWLNNNNLALNQINSWAVHPGGPRILDAVENCLSLPAEALHISRQVLTEFGNMSSPTVLFILQRLLLKTTPLPCVMLGFGPGLTIEAALLM